VVKRFALCLLVLALATPALATNYLNYPEALMRSPYSYGYVTNTFFQSRAAVADSVIYGTNVSFTSKPDTLAGGGAGADTVDVTINPAGVPGWLLVTIPEEANLTMYWIRFKESVDGSTHSFAYGQWTPVYVGGAESKEAFNVGLWDIAQLVAAGSDTGKVDIYWRTEIISD